MRADNTDSECSKNTNKVIPSSQMDAVVMFYHTITLNLFYLSGHLGNRPFSMWKIYSIWNDCYCGTLGQVARVHYQVEASWFTFKVCFLWFSGLIWPLVVNWKSWLFRQLVLTIGLFCLLKVKNKKNLVFSSFWDKKSPVCL